MLMLTRTETMETKSLEIRGGGGYSTFVLMLTKLKTVATKIK